MDQKIILTPGELYYLGSLLQARYIDYAYVAAMDDINKNYALYETGARSGLIGAGIITEDFSGNLEVDKNAQHILKPIFFGEFEACIDSASVGEEGSVITSRFHRCDGAVTMVSSTDDGRLAVQSVDREELKSFIEALLPDNYICSSAETVNSIPQESITRIIAVKNTAIGKSAAVKLFVECDGVIYSEKDEENAESLTAVMFSDAVLDILTGGM